MDIDDDAIFKFMGDMREGQGKTHASLENLEQYVKAVASKAEAIRAELAIHSKDDEAHGVGSNRKSFGDIRGWLAFIISLASVGLALAFK